jgi:ubiquinone/menaquinone biosynthesis C-methylase UbiE
VVDAVEKREAQRQWNDHPCGTGAYLQELEYGSREWFDAMRYRRYYEADRWILNVVPFSDASGKRLLEIGYGAGTDLLTWAAAGAEVHGIDITDEHHRLAERNFAVHGSAADLRVGDAAQLPWADAYFDVVYSLGVLHHTPDTVRCISEAWRVLKPGGLLILSLYHKWSAFHILHMLLYQGVIRRKLQQLGYRGLMSTVEYGADGINYRPLVKTYSKGQLRAMLSDFRNVRFQVAHFKREHLVIGEILPPAVESVLEPYLGWYLVAFARR